MNDYMRYRGKCKELSEAAVIEDPSLTLVRGFYYCPIWNREEPHWWTKGTDGTIYDPSAKQFPSGGLGLYREFKGTVYCERCGRGIQEEQAIQVGHYMVCSAVCCKRLIGL